MTTFAEDDLVTIDRVGSDSHGTVGMVVSAESVDWFAPARPRWVRVAMYWPGSATLRAYSFLDRDLRPFTGN